jgi:hypothetical protein
LLDADWRVPVRGRFQALCSPQRLTDQAAEAGRYRLSRQMPSVCRSRLFNTPGYM